MSIRTFLLPLLVPFVPAAQDPPSRVGRLSLIVGSVSFEPGGDDNWYPATLNRPLALGDQLFADNGARAEIRTSGVAFRLGSRTAFEFLNLDDQNIQVQLSEGSLNVRVRRLAGGENLEIDTPNQAFTIQRPGEYRIDMDADNNQSSVTVRDGAGGVTTNSGAFGVQSGQQAVVSGTDQVQYNVYAAPGDDDFDGWARSRDQHDDRLQSSRYVSQDMVGYEDLDDNGSWQSVPDYGEAWIPRGVPADWAPYHNGHWAWIDPWGWSWVDDAPWGFAPFHYGRWANFSGRWGWVPGPAAVVPVYAPALVAWFGVGGAGVSVGFGGEGCGWLPLGPRDVYIPAYQASPTYITRINVSNTTVINNVQVTNVYNNYTRNGNIPITSYSNHAVAGAAVAVQQNVLASGRPVQQGAVRMSPTQVASIRSMASAPRVAPQLPAAPRANVPRPPAAVTSRPIVAKSTPPPPPPSFQQRQAVLAKNPGKPIPMQQLHQMAPSAASAARPPVRVVTQARQVTPTVVNKPAPRTGPGGSVAQQPGTPPPARPAPQAQPNRSFEPPAAQHPAQQAPPNRSAQPQTEQPRATPQPNRPAEPTPARPTPQAQPNRSFEPPAAQHPAQQAPPNRSVQPQTEQPRVTPQPNRPAQPPPAQRAAPPAQPNRPAEAPREPSRPPQQAQPAPRAEPPREQPRAQPQPTRPVNPPAPQPRPQERPAQPAPPRAEPRPAPKPAPPPAKPSPTDKNDKKKNNEKPPQ